MSLKNTVILCLLGLLLCGAVLSQTNTVNRQTDSNIQTNANIQTNVIKINPNRIEAIMSPELQTETIDEVESAACQHLTESDAAKIFGKPMLYYTSTTYKKELKCMYMPPKEFPMGITFEIKTYESNRQAKAQLKSLVEISKSVNREMRSEGFPKDSLLTCSRKITPSGRRESTKIRIGDSSYEKDIYRRADRRNSARF